MSSDRVLIHAYGVLERRTGLPEWPPGIAGAPIHTVEIDPLVAVTSVLPYEEFEPSAWERHADDAAWLGAIATAHHRVLQAAIAAGDVVPFRLPSLYGGVEALRDAVTDHAPEIGKAMERITDRVEWAVKVYRTDKSDAAAEESESARTGRDYLVGRSREQQERAEADTFAHDRAQACYDRIGEVSVDAVRNAPQDPVLSGRREPMVHNAAFLVDPAVQAEFRGLVEEISQGSASDGLLVEASGPWPAYNFASLPRVGSVADPA